MPIGGPTSLSVDSETLPDHTAWSTISTGANETTKPMAATNASSIGGSLKPACTAATPNQALNITTKDQ